MYYKIQSKKMQTMSVHRSLPYADLVQNLGKQSRFPFVNAFISLSVSIYTSTCQIVHPFHRSHHLSVRPPILIRNFTLISYYEHKLTQMSLSDLLSGSQVVFLDVRGLDKQTSSHRDTGNARGSAEAWKQSRVIHGNGRRKLHITHGADICKHRQKHIVQLKRILKINDRFISIAPTNSRA